MHSAVDTILEIDNIIAGSNNISFRKVNVKPYEVDKV